MSKLQVELANIRSSTLGHNAAWMFAGQGLSIICQAVYFVLLARLLVACRGVNVTNTSAI